MSPWLSKNYLADWFHGGMLILWQHMLAYYLLYKIFSRELGYFKWVRSTVWKVSKYGVFSGLYFPVFRLNLKIYSINLYIVSKYRKIRTRKNSVFGHYLDAVKSPKDFTENLKNERDKFLKMGGKFSKKFAWKIKDKPQEIFSFQ